MWRRVVVLSLGLFLLLPALAYAQTWTPGPGSQGDSTIIGYIDYPKNDFSVKQGETLSIYGWVVDSIATGDTGIDDVQVYRGTSADQYLGRATFGIERQDVADHFGRANWKNSGFNYAIDTSRLSIGTQTLNVFAHTPAKGWWTKSISVNVLVNESSSDDDDDDVETVTIKTPHGHVLTAEPSLEEAISRLGETPWGSWALDIAADQGLQILWSDDLGDRFSQYQYSTRVILVNDTYKNADARTVAAAIGHELQHAVDDTFGWASGRAVTCDDLEARAFLAQSSTWNSFFGPFGKARPSNQLEDAHNAVQSVVTNRPSTWLDDAMSKYRSPCS